MTSEITRIQSPEQSLALSEAGSLWGLARNLLSRQRRYAEVLAEPDAEALSAAYPEHETPTSENFALSRAGMLLSCYPRGQAHEPEAYVAAIASILADYSQEVVAAVTDPRTGVPRTVKFLPSVAEVAEACATEADRRVTVGNLARQHLRIRREPEYRDRLERVLGYRVGRPEEPGNENMAARAVNLIKSATRSPRQAAE